MFFFADVEPTNLLSLLLDFRTNILNWLILVVILVLLVRRYLIPALGKRQETIAQSIAEANQTRQAAIKALQERKSKLTDLDGEAEKIIAEAKEAAEKMRKDVEAQTQKDMAEMLKNFEHAAENERRLALAEMRAIAVRAAIRLTESTMRSTMTQDTQSKLLTEFVEQLDHLSLVQNPGNPNKDRDLNPGKTNSNGSGHDDGPRQGEIRSVGSKLELSSVADQYAQALLELATENTSGGGEFANQISQDLNTIAQAISENADLKLILEHPKISATEKRSLLLSLFQNRVQDLTLRLLELLNDKRRLNLITAIASSYVALLNASLQIVIAKLVSSTALGDSTVADIKARLSEHLGKKLELEVSVDASLIGGFILRLGDQVIDGSLKGKLKNLEALLLSV